MVLKGAKMTKKRIYTRQDGKVFEEVNIGCYVDFYQLKEVKKKKKDKRS